MYTENMNDYTLKAIIGRIEQWKANASNNADNAKTSSSTHYYSGMEDAYSDVLDLLKG